MLTPAQRRELRSIAFDGNPSDPCDWQHAPEGLWFHARDRVLGALLRKELIYDDPDRSGYSLTPRGEEVLRSLGEAQ